MSTFTTPKFNACLFGYCSSLVSSSSSAGGGGAEFAGARITKGVSGVRPRSGGEVVGMMGGGVLDVFYTPMVTECWAVLGFCSGPVYFSLK